MKIEIKPEKIYLFSFLLGPLFGAVMVLFLMLDAALAGFASNNAYEYNAEIITRFEQEKQNADISVILLGNSRVRYAATFGFEPEDIVDMPDGRKMASLKFATNAAEFKIYGEYLDDILKAKPDYIVLMDMLFTTMRPPDRSMLVRYSKMVYDSFEEKIFDLDPKEAWTKDRHELQLACYKEYDLKLVNRRIESTAARDRHSLDTEVNKNIPQIREFVAKALSAGIKVAILHLPSNHDVLDEFDVPYYYIDGYGLDHAPSKQELLPDHYNDVMWLSYEEKEGRSAYCDFLHLNKKGRATFSNWFLKQI